VSEKYAAHCREVPVVMYQSIVRFAYDGILTETRIESRMLCNRVLTGSSDYAAYYAA
jgi:hypothetical protein